MDREGNVDHPARDAGAGNKHGTRPSPHAMGGTAAEPTTGIVCCRARGGSDHAAYIDGACVLTDSDGDQIFSTIWKATSVWHLHYAWRFTNLARISLDIYFSF